MLMCFAVARSYGRERSLMISQRRQCAGIFSCDDYMLFSDKDLGLGGNSILPNISHAQKGVSGAMTATWVNAAVFIQAWDMVIADGRFLRRDYVVKVDPDAVFLPGPLKTHFRASPPNFQMNDKGVYMKNC